MKPITREEMYLAAAAGYDVTPPEPVTRKEKFLAKLAGMEVETPTVFTRQERLLDEAASRAPSVTINNQDITVTENGQYTADEGYTGLGTVTVEVPDEPAVLEDLKVTENGNYTPSKGVDGFGSVLVNVPDIPAVVQRLEVTKNGTYTAPDGVDGYSPVTVNVPAPEVLLQDKTITENGEYTADEGFDGLSKVIVDVAGSGGGGKWAWGTFTGNKAPITINHNLGIIPDLVIIKVSKPATLSEEGLYEAVAFLEGKEGIDILGGGTYGWALSAAYGAISSYVTNFVKQKGLTTPIDSADGDPINNANETSFTVGNPQTVQFYPAAGLYNWIAVGGLT